MHKRGGQEGHSYLRENGHVDGDLEGAADEELGRRVAQVEVGRLEGVAAHPHQHHLHAEIEHPGMYSVFRQFVWKVCNLFSECSSFLLGQRGSCSTAKLIVELSESKLQKISTSYRNTRERCGRNGFNQFNGAPHKKCRIKVQNKY